MLRLVSSTVGPIPVAAGGTGPAQTVEAYNAGDGSLNLNVAVASSATWLAAAVGPLRACTTTTSAATCIPLNFTLNTSTLAAGKSYTAIVTVGDSGATTVDAPQTITVTVQVGGIDVYVAPGATQDVPLAANHPVGYSAKTQDGGNWLSLALDGTGSFRFVYPYHIHLAPDAGMAAGTYTGSVTTSGSTVPGENLTIPVTMRVTTQPIAQPVPAQVNVKLAQGAPPLVYPFDPFVQLVNLGQGTLTPGAIATSGGSWLKTDPAVNGFIAIDSTGLSPGTNAGTVTIPSNAVNAPTSIPVNLTVVAKGAPVINYQGVRDNVTSIAGDAVSQGDVAIVQGDQLSFSTYSGLQSYPLPTLVGGATVLVNNTPAPLYYTSYGQIAFQVPYDTPAGTALVQVKRDDGQISNTASVSVVARAPRLLAVVNQDGSYNTADGSHPAHVGDVIVIYAFGLGPVDPPVASGSAAPTSPLAVVTVPVSVSFGGNIVSPQATPFFAGLTPQFAGVYQVNVAIPDGTPTGILDLSLGSADSRSNSIKIAVQ